MLGDAGQKSISIKNQKYSPVNKISARMKILTKYNAINQSLETYTKQ